MAMAYAWCGMAVVSLVFSLLTGRAAEVGTAAMEGAAEAIRLCLSIAGPLILWSGLMEVMEQSGLSRGLARLLRPLLGRLFPSTRKDEALAEDLSCNLSANLLGLGNAATPAGGRAAVRLEARGQRGVASDELCRLVVLNTASVQLLPTTVAALRAGLGAESAFDILPAVWVSSLLSVCAGLAAARLFSRIR